MNNRAIVIRTIGDPNLCGAIVDGMTQQALSDSIELAEIKAAFERLKAKDALRTQGNKKRFLEARQELAEKYYTPTHGRVYNGVLGLWGLFWLKFYAAVAYFQKWNRGTSE